MLGRRSAKGTLRIGLATVAIAAIGSGCGGPRPLPGGFMFADDAASKNLSQAVTLIGGTQIRYLYGDGADEGRVERPVQLDYYARDVLDWHLVKSGSEHGTPVVQLGGAVDLSCAQELSTFAEIMKAVNRGGAPWFVAPGSHEGYLLGERHERRERWDAACGSSLDRRNGAMDKADFVKRYLETLVTEDDASGCVFPEMAALKASFAGPGLRGATCEPLSEEAAASVPREGGVPLEGCVMPEERGAGMLRAIAWRIDREAPFRSFVVQSLRLSQRQNPKLTASTDPSRTPPPPAREATGILLDTAAYDERPTARTALSLRADETGHLTDDEIAVVHRFALEATAAPREVVILFGHHPMESLSSKAKKAVDEIIDNYHVPLYVSAHASEGGWVTHDSDGSAWLELRLGSATGFPPEQRDLQLFTTNERLMVRSRLVRVNEIVRNPRDSGFLECKGAWQAAPGDPEYDDYYLDEALRSTMSDEERTARHRDALLRSHRRLFRTIRTNTATNQERYPEGCSNDDDVGEKILAALRGPVSPGDKARLLADLERFDRGRTVVDADCSRRFRLCQALWAGEHQALRGRALTPHDDTVVFPFR